MDSKLHNVLLVDDSLPDAILFKECLKNAGNCISLHHVDGGEQCLAFLRKEAPYVGVPTPDLIVLDINMPRMTGHEVMEGLLADPDLCQLPVIVLSTSACELDVVPMLKRRCNSYIVKPHDLSTLERVVEGICQYWFGMPGLMNSTSATWTVLC